jgi:nucleotide-binding universal stress UspA family protein
MVILGQVMNVPLSTLLTLSQPEYIALGVTPGRDISGGDAVMLLIHENEKNEVRKAAPLISNILVPVNFSKRSTGAASFALRMARRFDAKITLLHVDKPIEGDNFWTVQIVRWAKEQMDNILLESKGKADIQRIVSLHSDIADEILRVAATTGADLIVMPTRGAGTIRRALLGSVAAKVLQDATCPVWTSAHLEFEPITNPLKPARILCAANSATDDSRVLSWASQLASELNANLYVAWNPEAASETREEVDRLERAYQISAEQLAAVGNVPDALCRASAAIRADLLVVGRSFERSPEEPTFDMYQVVRESPCPVVSM